MLMTPIKIAAAFLICLASFLVAFAERLPIKIYTSADGLATSASFNIVRDSRGFIWLCSRDGLVRFDGYRFINYRIGDKFADPAVFNLLPTRSGDYWINLNRGTDYKFSSLPDDRVLSPLQQTGDIRVPFQAEPSTDLFPGFEDRDGNLWAASSEGLFSVPRPGEDTTTNPIPIPIDLPGNPTGMLLVVEFRNPRSGGGFWIGTNWGMVRRLADGRMFHVLVDPVGNSDVVRPFSEDAGGNLWIAKPDGIVVLKTQSAESLNANTKATVSPGVISPGGFANLPDTPGQAVKFKIQDLLSGFPAEERQDRASKTIVAAILTDSSGSIWITSTQGLIKFDGKRFHHYTTNNGLETNEVAALTEGPDGSIWIVSYGGLYRLNPRGLSSFDEFDGIERARIHNISENRAGDLVTISGDFNVGYFDGQKFTSVHPKLPADEIYTWQSSAGFLDSRGTLWLHTNKALYQFKNADSAEELDGRSPDAVYNEMNGLIGGNVLKTFEDSTGALWFSTYMSVERRGITRLDPNTGKFENFLTKDGLPDSAVPTGFAEPGDGSLWFAFVEGGFARYRDGKFKLIESESAPTGGLTSMFRDSKGRIWVATSREGLMMVADPTAEHPVFQKFTTSEGLTSNNVRCITEDNFGNIYIGTVRGVNRLSPETGRVVYYGTSDGLAADFVSSIFRDKTGNIWIGTFNGLSKLTPEPDRSLDPPQILISGLKIAGEDYSVSPLGQAEVRIPDLESGKGNIQVEFLSTGSSFSSPTRYQYRLNTTGEWSRSSTDSSVNFASLPAGSFRFEVRAVSDRDIVSSQPAFIQFTILRPLWQRWWFLLLAAIAISVIIYFVYRYRLAQAVKLERIRTRIASDLHDDIGSSLSQIAILSEVARQKAGENGASEPLKRIAETSREMVDSMSDIVWAINPKKDTLGDLVSRMRRFAEETFDATEIAYKFDCDDSQAGVRLGTDTRRDAYLIFKEAISNILKHANAEMVNITVLASGSSIKFTVADDGVGYELPDDPDQTFPGFGGNGLINMRRRAEQRGGEFSFTSTSGSGTTVAFSLPMKAGTVRMS